LLMENHNYRFHSSVQRIQDMIAKGKLGDIVDVQVIWELDVYGSNSPYIDANVPHHAASLRGGIIGDFLTHMAYLTLLFTGQAKHLRTMWLKRREGSPLMADEFRALLEGQRATAYLAFSGNAQPDGFWLRVAGTRAHAEANLFEPPWLTLRRTRSGEPALGKLIDGITEARDVLRGTVAGFARKLAGTSNYDGLPQLLARTYHALEAKTAQPVSLQEIDDTARLVEQFSDAESKL
jgi:predicted dehydrogenase